MPRLIVITVLSFAVGWITCSILNTQYGLNQVSVDYPQIEEYEIKSYPHIDSQMLNRINMNYSKLKIGMSKSEIYSIMGKPNEVRYYYEPKIRNARKLGYTCWYVAQRMKATGSAIEKDEKLLRISFSFRDYCTEIHYWGFEPQAEQDAPSNGG